MAGHIGVRRMVLADICPGLDNTLLIGIIIGSQSARSVTMKKGVSMNEERTPPNFRLYYSLIVLHSFLFLFSSADLSHRGVWNFTLRDSDADFVNAALWGSPEFVQSCADEFHIGTVGMFSCVVCYFCQFYLTHTVIL